METKIANLIKAKGPLTGQELLEHLQIDKLLLWRTCRSAGHLTIRIVGTRYIRFDRRMEASVRLSPSILREFLTYSLVGLKENPVLLEEKAQELSRQIRAISHSKSQLIFNIISALAANLALEAELLDQVCFILAGDIVYQMAHNVPRPERSTGKMVRGSDIDLVVIVDDAFPTALAQRLDAAIFEEKRRLLLTPHMMEEIDYVVKNLEKVREQCCFETFKHRVACKILNEGTFLFGSARLFQYVKNLLKQEGLVQKLNQMQHQAETLRKEAETLLLTAVPAKINTLYPGLFYPADESEEFE
ncbi:MAG: hypothetical protein EHM45_17745 [Desulfobacteraceae bacterium]|nr:MAG: hypothetical protein EHM45_17745 [Desulfobacteraceae bacterium]